MNTPQSIPVATVPAPTLNTNSSVGLKTLADRVTALETNTAAISTTLTQLQQLIQSDQSNLGNIVQSLNTLINS